MEREIKLRNEGLIMGKLIYVADDEKNIRELIQHFLIKEGFDTKVFETGDALLEAFKQQPADMIVLDIMMPGRNGLTICHEIRETHNVPIIIVSARDSEADRIAGITLGGDDYLAKPFSPMELVARINALFRRIRLDKNAVETNLLTFGNISMNPSLKTVMVEDESLDLTPTEYSLLEYFITHKNQAVSRKSLLHDVWKFDFEVDTRATDDAVKRLRKKIKESNVVITTVWGYGFKLELRNLEEV